MFKYKITIVLKSGYEIRIKAKQFDIISKNFGDGFSKCEIENFIPDIREIAAIVIKEWYQLWA